MQTGYLYKVANKSYRLANMTLYGWKKSRYSGTMWGGWKRLFAGSTDKVSPVGPQYEKIWGHLRIVNEDKREVWKCRPDIRFPSTGIMQLRTTGIFQHVNILAWVSQLCESKEQVLLCGTDEPLSSESVLFKWIKCLECRNTCCNIFKVQKCLSERSLKCPTTWGI